MIVAFRVDGRPTPQGSKIRTRYGMREAGGDNLVLWREAVRSEACEARGDNLTMGGPLAVQLAFQLHRPKKPRYKFPIGKNSGDIDKLTRAVFDGLTTSGLIADDGLMVEAVITKTYAAEGQVPGCDITVRQVDP